MSNGLPPLSPSLGVYIASLFPSATFTDDSDDSDEEELSFFELHTKLLHFLVHHVSLFSPSFPSPSFPNRLDDGMMYNGSYRISRDTLQWRSASGNWLVKHNFSDPDRALCPVLPTGYRYFQLTKVS